MQSFSRLAPFLIVFCASISSAYGTEPLRLVAGEFAPYTGEHLPHGGPLTEVVRRAFAESGHEVTIAYLPWKRGYSEAIQGNYVGTFPYVRNASREKDFLFSRPYFAVARNLFYLSGSKVNPDDLSTLKGKQVCAPLGYSVAPEINDMLERKELQLQNPNSLVNCVDMLLLGRVDAFAVPYAAGAAAISHATILGTDRILNKQISRIDYSFIVPKSNPKAKEVIQTFEKGISKLKQKGQLATLIKGL